MEKNKTGKYLKYAIGEIILVVVGILIALSINNWNEANKNKALERGFIHNLISDFESDIKQINEVIKINEEKLIKLDSILSYSNKNVNALPDHDRLYFYTLNAIAQRDEFKNMTRSLNQFATLKNGVVRQNVADSIVNFQQQFILINGQGYYYSKSIDDIQTLAFKLFNFNVINDSTYLNENGRTNKPMKIKSDLDFQFEFFNYVLFSRGVIEYYISDEVLKGHRQKTKDFIGFLETEYDLEQ